LRFAEDLKPRKEHSMALHKKIVLSLFTLLLTGMLLPMNSESAVTLRTLTEEGKTLFEIENNHFRMKISPSSGGRISSLYDKKAKTELLYWTKALGGLCDDRGEATLGIYKAEIKKNSSEEVEILLSFSTSLGIQYEKSITVFSNKPLFQVDYTISRVDGDPLDFTYMMRNFLLPGGKPLSDKIFYCYDTVEGPIRIPGSLLEKNHYVRNPVHGWHGCIDTENKAGIAVLTEEEKVDYFYYWTGEKTFPSFEWTYKTVRLEPSKPFSTKIYFILTNGLQGYSDITKEYALYCEKEEDPQHAKNITFLTHAQALWRDLDLTSMPILKSSIWDLEGKKINDLDDAFFRLRIQDGTETVKQQWNAPKEGTYVIQQEIFSAGNRLGGNESPFIAGKADGTFVRKAKTLPPQEFILKLTAEDIKNGFVPAFAPPANKPASSIQEVRLLLGKGDTESSEIFLYGLRKIDQLTISLAALRNEKGEIISHLPLSLRLQQESQILPFNGTLSLSENTPLSLWLTAHANSLPPGKYRSAIQFQQSPQTLYSLPVILTIDEKRLPLKTLSYWMHYDIYSILAINGSLNNKKKSLELWPHYVQDLVEHGVDVLCFQDYPKKLPLIPFVKVKEFQEGYLPVLDFTETDEFLEIAIKGGLRKAVLRYNWFSRDWLPQNFSKEKNPEEWEKAALFMGKQVSSYFEKKGFELFLYLVDEPRTDAAESIIERISFAKKSCPNAKIAVSLSAMTPEFIQKLTPFIDIWEFQRGSAIELFLQWLEEKKVTRKKEDLIGFYGGAMLSQSYLAGRLKAWEAWHLGLSFYSDYAYIRPGNNEYRVFSPGIKPIPSPVWEGIRDGNRDFEYLSLLSSLLEKAEKNGTLPKEKILSIQQQLQSLIGSKGLLKWIARSRTGFLYHQIETDPESLRKAKEIVFQLIDELSQK